MNPEAWNDLRWKKNHTLRQEEIIIMCLSFFLMQTVALATNHPKGLVCSTMSTAKCSLHLLKTQLYIVTRNTHFQYILPIDIFSDLSWNNAAMILMVFSPETPKRYWFHIRRKLPLMSLSPTLFSEKDKEKKEKKIILFTRSLISYS